MSVFLCKCAISTKDSTMTPSLGLTRFPWKQESAVLAPCKRLQPYSSTSGASVTAFYKHSIASTAAHKFALKLFLGPAQGLFLLKAVVFLPLLFVQGPDSGFCLETSSASLDAKVGCS
ncbi:unnamed protein product [Tetraodon nigroviridis]|uniref:Chromosome 5 SCAF14581, whole genome shotgun sequence n=1 Tax=Tetraodon nigroviridis TaxID=99883 RepID=Q4SHF3_TETNG|nr:unnamed protein product [Tetraodon nigroviridis]